METSSGPLSLYHLLNPAVLGDPYPLFRRLRSEAPVHWDPYLHAWVVTTYDDVLEVLHTFSADRTPTPEQLEQMGMEHLSPLASLMTRLMLFMDSPSHTRLRGLAASAFTPGRVEKLRQHIAGIVDGIFDQVGPRGRMDVISELAEPLPAIVTAEMLGLPPEDRVLLKTWSANFAEMLGNFQHNPERVGLMLSTVKEMTAYFQKMVRRIKEHPTEGLIHSMLNADVGGERLTEDEVIANSIVTMIGGLETTTNLIGNGVLTLLRHPDQLVMLENDLSLVPSAVEEMLRFESPSQHTARIVPGDRLLGGQSLRKGQAVIAVMAAANRDPKRFPNPDVFDVARTDNRHLAFGYGAHYCFGAALARIEGQLAFHGLLRRLGKLKLSPQTLTWRSNLGLRGLTSLLIDFEPRDSFEATHNYSSKVSSLLSCPHMKEQSAAPQTSSASYNRCVHELFEEQALGNPKATAASYGQEKLSYTELNARANKLAHFLLERGTTKDTPVAICMKRSLALPVAILGVLKAGGACLPLDPAYPAGRLAYIMKDSQAAILITDKSTGASSLKVDGEVICLADGTDEFESFSPLNPEVSVLPSDLAYVIYTSGSTGQPRGVLLEHGGLVNHQLAGVELYGLGPSDRMLQFSALGFDIAMEEMFCTWAAGGTVVFRTEEMPLVVRDFIRWVEQEAITVLDLPTAYWHEMVHELADNQAPLPSSLRLVIVGGEKASSSAYKTWMSVGGDKVRWINTYGPTETSVIATAFEPSPSQAVPDNIPIGKEIRNYTVRVVDSELKNVPTGTPGELLIGGPGVARGYLNRPEQTALKFISYTAPEGGTARLYKTGDLVRVLEDGNIEFIGRTDFQVKIRGFRVELEEIEAALEKHPKVIGAVVTAMETHGGKTLFAYIVPRDRPPAPGELRSFLLEALPDYMVPASYSVLAKLPLTPNGKVDRRALPAPALDDLNISRSTVEPRDELESRMQKVWQQVLGHKRIGMQDNFFELGGHSLIAVRLMQRIEKEFGKNLLITKLLEAPTVETLTNLVRSNAPADLCPSIIPLQPRGMKEPLFFVHGLFGSVLRFRDMARCMEPDQPLYGIQAQGLDGVLAPLDRVESMATLYYEQLRRFRPHGPYHLGGYSFGGLVALELAQRLKQAGEEVGLLALVDTYVPSKTSSGLIRRFSSLSIAGKFQYSVKRLDRFRKGLRTTVRVLTLPPAVKAVREAAALAEREYKPLSYQGKITLFRASEKGLRGLSGPQSGWEHFAQGGVEVVEIDGDHGSILNEPTVQVLAGLIRDHLSQASVVGGI
jgi:amino acid adenylation domain-containing protein